MSRWERHCFPPKAQPIHMWAHTSHTRTPRRYYYILCALFASDWKRVHRRRYRVFSGGTGCLAATGARDDMVLSTDGNSSAGWARVIFTIVLRPVYDDDDAFNIKLLLFRSTYLRVRSIGSWNATPRRDSRVMCTIQYYARVSPKYFRNQFAYVSRVHHAARAIYPVHRGVQCSQFSYITHNPQHTSWRTWLNESHP